MRRVVVVIVAFFALAACGGSNGDGNSSTTTSQSSSTSSGSQSSSSSTTQPKQGLKLTEDGLGTLELGMTADAAMDTGLIGALGPGCEAADPDQQGAPLTGSVKGNVTFHNGVLSAISVLDGASTAAGIHVGSTIADVQGAYGSNGYAVAIDNSTVATFGVVLATVTHNGQPALAMTVDPGSGAVVEIAVPTIQFCD